jgi:hypothetical protein
MGIDANGARFLLDASQNGVDFGRCATLGRQEMHLSTRQLEKVFQRFSVTLREGEADSILANNGCYGYCESFLTRCGAKQITSFDNSSYEGATVIHDFNAPLPVEYEDRFSCLIDSGTLEHVFDFPSALRNCMKMVEPGGHFLSITPCNNFMGHGFYQFSPELFYGVLAEKNGYSLERMFIFESRPDAQWYRVAAPTEIGGRVELRNSAMTYLLIQAKRTGKTVPSDITPQQSDYIPMWDSGQSACPPSGRSEEPGAFTRYKGYLKGFLQAKGREALQLMPVESLRTPFRRPWYEPYE